MRTNHVRGQDEILHTLDQPAAEGRASTRIFPKAQGSETFRASVVRIRCDLGDDIDIEYRTYFGRGIVGDK